MSCAPHKTRPIGQVVAVVCASMTGHCDEPMPDAKNGASRGFCNKSNGHRRYHRDGSHNNGTCRGCGVALVTENARPSWVSRKYGLCRVCHRDYQRQKLGQRPRNLQLHGQAHKFPCGCCDVLPERGCTNKFAKGGGLGHGHICRVSDLLNSSRQNARVGGYTAIACDTSHVVIRRWMEEPNCWRCQQPLDWNSLGRGKTPHLHHNHITGEIYGFTHSTCNPHAEEEVFDRLYDENRRIRESQTVFAATYKEFERSFV